MRHHSLCSEPRDGRPGAGRRRGRGCVRPCPSTRTQPPLEAQRCGSPGLSPGALAPPFPHTFRHRQPPRPGCDRRVPAQGFVFAADPRRRPTAPFLSKLGSVLIAACIRLPCSRWVAAVLPRTPLLPCPCFLLPPWLETSSRQDRQCRLQGPEFQHLSRRAAPSKRGRGCYTATRPTYIPGVASLNPCSTAARPLRVLVPLCLALCVPHPCVRRRRRVLPPGNRFAAPAAPAARARSPRLARFGLSRVRPSFVALSLVPLRLPPSALAHPPG
jgi:hypothetical protein